MDTWTPLGAACQFLGWFDIVRVCGDSCIVRVKQVSIDAPTSPMCRLLSFASYPVDTLPQFFRVFTWFGKCGSILGLDFIVDLLGNSIGGLDLVIPHKFVFSTQENLYLGSDEGWVSTGSGYCFDGVKVIEHGHNLYIKYIECYLCIIAFQHFMPIDIISKMVHKVGMKIRGARPETVRNRVLSHMNRDTI